VAKRGFELKAGLWSENSMFKGLYPTITGTLKKWLKYVVEIMISTVGK
jgi:hypothetical protein